MQRYCCLLRLAIVCKRRNSHLRRVSLLARHQYRRIPWRQEFCGKSGCLSHAAAKHGRSQ